MQRLDALVAAAFGPGVRVSHVDPIEPWAVMRCTLEGAGAPPTAIVKWLRDDPNGFRVDQRQIATEQAALEFLGDVGFGGAPRLYAADLDAGVLLLEDVGGTPLADLIRRDGAEMHEDDLAAFARLLGELGARTAGKATDYAARRAGHGEPDRAVGRARGLGPVWPATRAALATLGLPLDGDAAADLVEVERTIREPGPFLVLTNGDAQPNNGLVTPDGMRLIDFEFADFRHALVSAAWIHTPGPAWLTVAHPRNTALEDAFRRALAAGVPEAEDEALFGGGMAAVCLAEALDRFARFPALDARPAGDLRRAQMIATLEAGAAAARRHKALPALARWQERAAEWLRRRWPDADVDLAAVAAYAPRR